MTFQEPINPKTFVIYHANCNDGLGAAAAAYLKLGETAQYLPGVYSETLDKFHIEDSDIYIVDFSFDREIIEAWKQKARKVVVIDHHESSFRKLEGLDDFIYDGNKSGAVLAFEYFNPEQELPEIFKLIQDGDLYKFEFGERTRYLRALLDFYRLKLTDMEMIRFMSDFLTENEWLDNYIQTVGRVLANYITEVSGKVAKENKFRIIDFHGFRFAFYNVIDHISETAEHVYNKGSDESGYYPTLSYYISPKKVIFNMRSSKRSTIVVNKIAENYGGGGHPNAAGFTLSLEDGLKLITKLYVGDNDAG